MAPAAVLYPLAVVLVVLDFLAYLLVRFITLFKPFLIHFVIKHAKYLGLLRSYLIDNRSNTIP
jgi:hypothetical protein